MLQVEQVYKQTNGSSENINLSQVRLKQGGDKRKQTTKNVHKDYLKGSRLCSFLMFLRS